MGLALLVVLVTFANTFYAGYLQQREMLIRNTLESNQAYATKAAGLTDGFLQQALSQSVSYTHLTLPTIYSV